jgi:hypothetical protein
MNTIEMKAVEQTQANDVNELRELTDLQLAAIGGGIADPIFA